jgi:hypothetical protein
MSLASPRLSAFSATRSLSLDHHYRQLQQKVDHQNLIARVGTLVGDNPVMAILFGFGIGGLLALGTK